jgi:hypothetical protein
MAQVTRGNSNGKRAQDAEPLLPDVDEFAHQIVLAPDAVNLGDGIGAAPFSGFAAKPGE